MLAELDKSHMEMLLKTNNVGRIACVDGDRPYIVPVSYVYEDGCIYGHTNDGKKLEMMRSNPSVCFAVDEIKSFRKWESVICWGRFEELEGAEMVKALDLMIDRLLPSTFAGLDPEMGAPLADVYHQIRLGARKGATYRIRVDEMTGRYERP